MESELKLKVDPQAATMLVNSPALRSHAVSEPAVEKHVDRYFDTENYDLWNHGFSLRVRSTGREYVQTLKGAGSTLAGVHHRTELESIVASDAPDEEVFLRQLREAQPKLADDLSDRRLDPEPVFINRVERTSWLVALPDGCRIECALDVGQLQHGDRTTAVRELELEIKEGDPAHLYELAQQVHATIPMRVENSSKAARGYALACEERAQSVKAIPVALKPKVRLGEAYGLILRNCLQHIQANEPGVLAGDVESLHQMRVGMRRLRAAQAMVRDMVQMPAPIADDIEWISGELGDARNWDVLLTSVLPSLPIPDEQRAALARIETAAREQGERHRARVRAAISSARYTSLMLALGGWIAQKGWQPVSGDNRVLEKRIGTAAPKLVRHAAARLRKRARTSDLRQPACLHKVRIAAKKERYAREFFAALTPDKKAKRRRDELAKIQDQLGHVNDTVVARGLVKELHERVPQESRLLGFIEGALAIKGSDAISAARQHLKGSVRSEAK